MRVIVTWHAAVEQSYRKLFSELSAQGVDIRLILPNQWIEGGRLVSYLPNGSETYQVSVLRTVFTNHIRAFFYPDILMLFKEISGFRPDIIHIMEEPFSMVATEFMIIKRLISPYARTVLYSFENIDFKQTLPYSIFQRYNVARSDAIITVPEEGIEIWQNRGAKTENIYHIPLGIDTDIYYKRLPRVIEERGEVFKIGYVGRLVKEKGIDIILDALKILKEGKNQGLHLYIVGTGPYKSFLKKKITRLQLERCVTFVGLLSQEQLSYFYSQIDALILPSITTFRWKEQFGRVIVEAMACETPVIGSSSGEIPNVIGDAGLIFPEGDSAGLARCIERLIEDRTFRTELSIRGMKRVLKYYSWSAVARKYIAVYEDILKRG